jgi:hypothetical protein
VLYKSIRDAHADGHSVPDLERATGLHPVSSTGPTRRSVQRSTSRKRSGTSPAPVQADPDTVRAPGRIRPAALRRAARERGGPLPSIGVADALLDERVLHDGMPRHYRCYSKTYRPHAQHRNPGGFATSTRFPP